MNIDESKASLPMKNRVKAVRSGIEICNEVYEEDEVSMIIYNLHQHLCSFVGNQCQGKGNETAGCNEQIPGAFDFC